MSGNTGTNPNPNTNDGSSGASHGPLPPSSTATMNVDHPAQSSTTQSGKDQSQAQTTEKKPRPKQRAICRFWIQGSCRKGPDCPFRHPEPTAQGHGQSKTSANAGDTSVFPSNQNPTGPPNPASSSQTQNQPRQLQPPIRAPQAPQVPQVDPRTHAINQLTRRFSPSVTTASNGTTLSFTLIPSDPDFPFELAGLKCALFIPLAYPSSASPKLNVTNSHDELPRGYGLNIERGFDEILQSTKGTLLRVMNLLDRRLEEFLSREKVETVKIVVGAPSTRTKEVVLAAPIPEKSEPSTEIPKVEARPVAPSDEDLKAASARRKKETTQLEARLGRDPLYFKSGDGLTFTLPLTIRQSPDLSSSLRQVKKVYLIVPTAYPLSGCRVEFRIAAREEARIVEDGFARHVSETPGLSLMQHLNWLGQNIASLAKTKKEETEKIVPAASSKVDEGEEAAKAVKSVTIDDKPHVVVIPRPPEWDSRDDDEEGHTDTDGFTSSDFYDSESEDEDEESENEKPNVSEPQTTTPINRGVALSFPDLAMHGIELVELSSLSLTLKCLRCKTPSDISNLRSGTPKSESCKKCASSMTDTFRRELIHSANLRAGYIDLDGCTIADMLPSKFTLTCSTCSSSTPDVTAVRGDSAMSICRECHSRLTLRIVNVSFLVITQSVSTKLRPLKKKPPKDILGIVTGQPLPKHGACSHYRKSLRWFRFSCCDKIYACDRCHDKADGQDHPAALAHRMLCGYCSREQNFRPEDCGTCRATLVAKAGSGFWEGGKGTRDKRKMSRKDPRKYKRVGGSKVGSGTKYVVFKKQQY